MYMRYITLPNILSISRLFITPLAVYMILSKAWVPALLLLILAIVTDVADGYFARRWHQTSALGGLLDHSSDALLVGSMLAAEAYLGFIPWGLPLLVILAFLQYTLDSKALAGQPLRASIIGRSNGILYFVIAGLPILQQAGNLSFLSNDIIQLLAYLLIISSLISITERLYTFIKIHSSDKVD